MWIRPRIEIGDPAQISAMPVDGLNAALQSCRYARKRRRCQKITACLAYVRIPQRRTGRQSNTQYHTSAVDRRTNNPDNTCL